MATFLDTTPPRAPEGYGNLHGKKSFVPAAHEGLNNATQRRNLLHATTTIRNKRQHAVDEDRKSTRLNSSHVAISYAVFCLKKKRTELGIQVSKYAAEVRTSEKCDGER